MQAENIRRVHVSSDHAPQARKRAEMRWAKKSGSPEIGSRSKVDLGGNATKLLKTVLRPSAEGMINKLTKNLHHDDFFACADSAQKKSGSADNAASRSKVWFGRKRNQVAGEDIRAVWLTRRKRRKHFLRLLFFADDYPFIAVFRVGSVN